MRGTILGYDAASGTGAINDLSGGRLKFTRDAWRSPGEPVAGRLVDFEVAEGEATEIFLVPGSGGVSLDFSGDDPARTAMTAGIVSLVCAVASFIVPFVGPFTLVVSIFFGIKGKNLGRELPDKTAYYLSIAGLVISGIALAIVLLALVACAGVIGVVGLSSATWN
ncbi:hypothetical protein OF829_15690 [Sphingomonas sp. LB-2]|uniref:hypothetical protein n=1 Tax=Sphingomonas caeni TaxID=2984949 RepID=UPI00222FAA54|nr:hypothetical protein [Sphingomonas caeni]MCW3848678.1 hypothetical protein [Sphingomonas caeni]